MSVGFRVFQTFGRPSRQIVQALTSLALANLSDSMHGLYTIDPGIRPVVPARPRVVGPALTVSVSPGDGLMLRAAIDVAEPGDVLVVNAFGVSERSVLGGTVLVAARERGIAAVVIDGAIRDRQEAVALGLPLSARAVCARSGTTTAGAGEVNVPVACGGVVVQAGDLVVVDEEGIVVVPRSEADEVVADCTRIQETKGRPEDISEEPTTRSASVQRVLDRTRTQMVKRGAVVIPGPFTRS